MALIKIVFEDIFQFLIHMMFINTIENTQIYQIFLMSLVFSSLSVVG